MTILSQIGDSCRQLYGDLGEAMLTLISRVGNVGVVERKVAHFLLGDLVEYRKIGPDG